MLTYIQIWIHIHTCISLIHKEISLFFFIKKEKHCGLKFVDFTPDTNSNTAVYYSFQIKQF